MIDNINITRIDPLVSPGILKEELPISKNIITFIEESRHAIQNILSHKEDRFIVITGPCSIHNTNEALEYAQKLSKIASLFKDKLFIIMRAYFEKPRTTIGWKGMIYDPDLDGSSNISKGLRNARKLLIEIAQLHLPIATEILDPITVEYIADLISYAAIGARTTESQPHRQLVSGLSMPVGFKNGTDGNIKVAIDAIKASSFNHAFIGIMPNGKIGIFHTKGNRYANIILRGGTKEGNYSSEFIAYTKELLNKNHIKSGIIIDCSHGNSNKVAKKQLEVLENVIMQKKNGEDAIIGVMLESNLKHGKQNITQKDQLKYGISITDECIGWEDTEKAIKHLYNSLKSI